jgi:assimilatory nitrate reductase electron transfer subunit
MTSTSPRRIVVAGGGMAGARLVAQLARLGRAADVTWIGEEPQPAYNRLLLAEVLAGRYAPEITELPHSGGAARVRRGVRIVRIDRERRTVDCDDGERVGYDALVLATGSNPLLPPLRGLFEEDSHDLPAGVHAFRTMADCRALAADAAPGSRAVIVGGGLLGVSAARALAVRGVQVVLAHQGEHLMDRHLDPQAARLLRDHLADAGVEVHTECRVRGVTTGSSGRRITGVELADGYVLQTDTAVLACGVRPRTGLALAAGLAVGRGVAVDDRMTTSDPAILAVGDCAEHRGTVYGLAGPAREQADVAARVLTGDHSARYEGTRTLTRLTLNGPGTLDIAAFGDPAPAPGDDVLRLSDATRGAYRKVVVRGDRLVGGILLGDLATVGALARTWEGDEPLSSQPLHLLTTDGGSIR